MKKEKIEELFYKHSLSISLLDTVNKTTHPLVGLGYRTTNLELFTQAINQAELEWYKELNYKLQEIAQSDSTIYELVYYTDQIQNKIKELENGK